MGRKQHSSTGLAQLGGAEARSLISPGEESRATPRSCRLDLSLVTPPLIPRQPSSPPNTNRSTLLQTPCSEQRTRSARDPNQRLSSPSSGVRTPRGVPSTLRETAGGETEIEMQLTPPQRYVELASLSAESPSAAGRCASDGAPLFKAQLDLSNISRVSSKGPRVPRGPPSQSTPAAESSCRRSAEQKRSSSQPYLSPRSKLEEECFKERLEAARAWPSKHATLHNAQLHRMTSPLRGHVLAEGEVVGGHSTPTTRVRPAGGPLRADDSIISSSRAEVSSNSLTLTANAWAPGEEAPKICARHNSEDMLEATPHSRRDHAASEPRVFCKPRHMRAEMDEILLQTASTERSPPNPPLTAFPYFNGAAGVDMVRLDSACFRVCVS